MVENNNTNAERPSACDTNILDEGGSEIELAVQAGQTSS